VRATGGRNWSAALLSICIASLTISPTAAQSTTQAVQDRVAIALDQLRRFESLRRINETGPLAYLQVAITTMQSAPDLRVLTSQNFTEQRRLMVSGWVQMLKVIEDSYDPEFNPANPHDLPVKCPPPPGGVPCAEDPNTIQDPGTRAAYIAELKQNNFNARRVNYYWRLKMLDMQAMSILEGALRLFAHAAPNGIGPDYTALDQILRDAGLSDTRRKTIDAYLLPPPASTSSAMVRQAHHDTM
jgi:hypothetical protein